MLKEVRPAGFDPTVDASIPCSPHAPGAARRAIEGLADAVDAEVLRDAQLLVSEVVTNSIKHAGSDEPIQLRVWTGPNGLKVEVADGGFGFDNRPPADSSDDEGGRGLLIVEALADRWGTSHDARARVWFELSPRPVSRSAEAG